ncbi:PIG-L family deacetylase [Candidatus Binatia bacterium]|nr:PIG-L family deacetylase [Candidatus Binatia bacterium]
MDAPLPYPETWLEPPEGPVLVLAPHPDDETIGCGAVLALHARRGQAVQIVVVTDGDRGDPEGRFDAPGYVERRRAECRDAARVLGVHEPRFLGHRDQHTDPRQLRGQLAGLLDELTPAVVYHPAAPEMHPDHHVVGRVALDVLTERGGRARSFAYESWAPVLPTHVIDVTAVWDVKQKALACYASQLVYNDYARACDGLAAYRAIFLPGALRVEAFAETTPLSRRRQQRP